MYAYDEVKFPDAGAFPVNDGEYTSTITSPQMSAILHEFIDSTVGQNRYGKYRGFDYCIALIDEEGKSMYFNGYLNFTVEQVAKFESLDKIMHLFDFEPHGGITCGWYANGIVGFDTNHYTDLHVNLDGCISHQYRSKHSSFKMEGYVLHELKMWIDAIIEFLEKNRDREWDDAIVAEQNHD